MDGGRRSHRLADGLSFDDSFSGTVVCTADGQSTTYPWTASAGEATAATEVPVGSSCTVTETGSANPAGGTWQSPVITPASFTVDAPGTAISVTVTNTLQPDEPVTPVEPDQPLQPGLPGTGGTVPWWAIALGGVLVVSGASALIVAARRRRHGE